MCSASGRSPKIAAGHSWQVMRPRSCLAGEDEALVPSCGASPQLSPQVVAQFAQAPQIVGIGLCRVVPLGQGLLDRLQHDLQAQQITARFLH
jgi:hypothetical protein